MRETVMLVGMLVITVASVWRLPSFWRGNTALRHRDTHVPAPSSWLRGIPAGIVGLPFATISIAAAMVMSSRPAGSEPPVAVAVFVGSLVAFLVAFVVMAATALFGLPRVAVPPWLRDPRARNDAELDGARRDGG